MKKRFLQSLVTSSILAVGFGFLPPSCPGCKSRPAAIRLPSSRRLSQADSSALEKLRKQSAAKKKQVSRAMRVRKNLNLPDGGDRVDALNAAERNIMSSICVAEEYDTAQLVEAMPGNAVLVGDVAAVGLPNAAEPSSGPPIAFFFPYGSVVLWGFTENEAKLLLAKAAPYADGPLPPTTAAAAEDRIAFFSMTTGAAPADSTPEGYFEALSEGGPSSRSPSTSTSTGGTSTSTGGTSTSTGGNSASTGGMAVEAPLEPASAGSGGTPGSGSPRVSFARTGAYMTLADVSDPLAKLSVSYAFAQSAKLNTLEFQVDELVEDIRPIPEALAREGKFKFSQRDAARLTGRTFLLSSAVNLYSDILDVPDFFWENDQYEPLYRRANSYLDVDDRTDITNSRLTVVGQLLDNLGNQLAQAHGTTLELIIIWLIVIEVLFELPHVPFGRAFQGLKAVLPLFGMG